MKTELRSQAVKLRLEQQLGYASIAKLVPVSKSTLSGWLRNYPLPESRIRELRKQNLKNNDAKIEAFRNTMRTKRDDKFQASYQAHLRGMSKLSKQTRFIAGLMLYLAEGAKKDYYHISLANTDVRVIKFFIRWAEDFLGISKKLLKFQLHLYPTMDIAEEVKYWKSHLEVSKSQFYKNQIRKLQKASFTYRESFRHGTCSIFYSSSEKKRELM